MTDEGITLTYINQAGNRRCVSLTPREPGGWYRTVEEYDGDDWHEVGSEIVADVGFSVNLFRGAGRTVTGPEMVDR